MGVYIKGMKIPNGCTECAFGKGFQYCEAMPPHFCGEVEWEMDDVKPEWCPLVEVKEPHGDLIDRDDVLRISTAVDAYDYISSQEVSDIKAVIEGRK